MKPRPMERSHRTRSRRNQAIVLAVVGLAFAVRWIGVPLHLAEHHHHLEGEHGVHAGSLVGFGQVASGHGEHAPSGHAHVLGAEHPEPGDREPSPTGHSIEDHLDGLAEATLPRVQGLDVLAPVAETGWSLHRYGIVRCCPAVWQDSPRPPPPRDSGPPRAPPIVT